MQRRRSLTGSRFASISALPNRSHFYSGECIPTIPPTVYAALNVFAPQALRDRGIPPSGCSLTVRVFLSPATSGDLAVQTTCSITTGGERVKLWTEFVMLSPSLVSAALTTAEAEPIPDKALQAQSYRLWMSRVTIRPDQMRSLSHSFGTVAA